MKKLFSLILLFVVLAIQNVYAVVAYPYPIDIHQSDGTILTIMLKGDEKVAWAKTLDNYTLMRGKNSDYVYAISDGKGGIMPSDIVAHNLGERTQREVEFVATLSTSLFYSAEQISIMKQYWAIEKEASSKMHLYEEMNGEESIYKILVVLMSYNDYAFTTPRENVEALFNQVGYSVNGHQGSVHDYFFASTFGKLNVQATVVGPYVAANGIEYYGENYPGTHSDMHARTLITEAVQYADADVDLSQFANGGTHVPCVYVIYAGFAESSGNADYTIWPHQGMLMNPLVLDGVQVQKYSCSSEFNGTQYSRQDLAIGTICHEFSHALGQPDYYDTDYEQNGEAFVPGDWDIMSNGNYNNGGKCPPLWSAMERTVGSYITIEEINANGTYTLPPLAEANKAYKINFEGSNEYFILENRQKTGWDSYVPGHGMLIFRVNPNVAGWGANAVNAVAGNEGYLLISANNGQYVGSGNPFPGTSNKTSFTDYTSPNSRSAGGLLLGKPIYNITENTTTKNIVFSFMDTTNHARIVNSSVVFNSDTISMQATISSNLAVSSKGFCYSTQAEPTINDNVITSTASGSSIAASLTTYTPNTLYYVRAFATVGNTTNYGETFRITTPCDEQTMFPLFTSFESEETHFGCWQQESTNFVSNKWQSVDSTNVVDAIEGAYNGERFAYIYNAYAYANQETMLVTPAMDITRLSQPKLTFAHHQKSNGNHKDNLTVYYKTSATGDWVLLKNYNSANISSWTRDTINLPVKSKTLFLGFKATLKAGYGVALDDVEVFESNVSAFPSVATNSVEDVTDNTALVNLQVLSAGYTALDNVGVVISENPIPTVEDQMYLVPTPSLGNFQINIENLESSTTYYVRAFAQNQGLTSYGQELSFTTLCSRVTEYPYTPELNTSDTMCFVNEGSWFVEDDSYAFAANTSGFTSKLILPIMDLTYRDNMSISFSYKQNAVANNSFRVLFRNGIDGQWEELANYTAGTTSYTTEQLTLSTTANHQAEEAYIAFEATSALGAKLNIKDINIQAVSQIPSLIVDTAYLSAYNAISMTATINYGGLSSVTSRGVCYSKTNSVPTTSDNTLTSGNGVGTYTVNLQNLDLLTTYYVRPFATNSYGTSYGEVVALTTLFIPIENNTISEDQNLCAGSVPARLQGSEPTGGNGEYEYLWVSSTDSLSWEPCSEGSVNNMQWYNPRQLYNTTYYCRVVTSGASVDTSNVVTITISSASRGGNVFATADSVFMGDTITMQLKASNGDVMYWEYKKPYYDWQVLEASEGYKILETVVDSWPSNSEGYWSYRAVVKNGACNAATSGKDSIYVIYRVGLDEILQEPYKLVITPNPSDGNVVLVCEKSVDRNVVVTISTMSGNIVETRNMILHQGDNNLNLTTLSSGTYIINVKGDDINWTGKLVVTKR